MPGIDSGFPTGSPDTSATGHDAVGEQCVVSLREGVAAVAPQREEREAVIAPLEHDPARPAVVILALRLRLPPGPQP
jgi:hypothetical protein